MSNKISRRTFLKCTGASAAALGTAALLGGCQSSSNASVEVKVGDKVSNWNNLGVQLTSVFTLTSAPDVPGHEYVAVLVTAVNRSSSVTFNIGAPQHCRDQRRLPAGYRCRQGCQHGSLLPRSVRFHHRFCRGLRRCRRGERRLHLPVRQHHRDLYRCLQPAPRSAPATLSWSAWCPPAGSRSRSPIPRPLSPTRRSLSA